VLQLLAELVLRYRVHRPRDAEARHAGELDVGTHLEVQLEGERLPLVEVYVLDARLARRPDLLALEDGLVGFLEKGLDGFLANGLGEPLPHHGRRRLAGSEPGDAHLRCVAACRLIFRVPHLVGRHGDLEHALEPVGLLRCDLDIHE
jgi:hypothetical protein